MGTVKDRNGMNLTEAEEIKKRWQKYTEELYKKDHDDWDNHNDVITHLEPDILECEVKWTLGSITMNKATGSDGIPVELFQILKDDAVKVLHSIYQQIWLGFPHSSVGKDSACSAGDTGLIPGLGRSPGEGIGYPLQYSWAFLVAQLVKNLPAVQETRVGSLDREDPLEKCNHALS